MPDFPTYLAGSCLQEFEDCQCILQHSTHTVDPGNPAGSYMLPDHHCRGSMMMRTWWIPNMHINKSTSLLVQVNILEVQFSLTSYFLKIYQRHIQGLNPHHTDNISTYKNMLHQAWIQGRTLTMTIGISKTVSTELTYLCMYPLPNIPSSHPTLHTPVHCFTWVNTPVLAKKFLTYWLLGVLRGHGQGKHWIFLAGSPYSLGPHSCWGTQRPNQGPSDTRL